MALQRRQLEIEVIEPARADRDAAELRAKGEAANILENGLAEIEVLKQKNEVWTIAGPNGKELLLIQMLPSLVEQITAMAKDIKIDHLAVVDSGNGGQSGLPAVVNQIGTLAPALFESIKATTGVDLASVIADKTDGQVPPQAG